MIIGHRRRAARNLRHHVEALERRELLAGVYQLSSAANTTGGLTSIGDLVSMNSSGQIAFVASTSIGQGLVGSSRVDLQACKLEYSIVSPK